MFRDYVIIRPLLTYSLPRPQPQVDQSKTLSSVRYEVSYNGFFLCSVSLFLLLRRHLIRRRLTSPTGKESIGTSASLRIWWRRGCGVFLVSEIFVYQYFYLQESPQLSYYLCTHPQSLLNPFAQNIRQCSVYINTSTTASTYISIC